MKTAEEAASESAASGLEAVPSAPKTAARFVSGADGTFDLDAYRGRVVLVDVWATWSPPCRAAVPDLNRLYEECNSQGLTVVGLAVDRASSEDVAAAVRELGVIYPVALATQPTVQNLGEVRALPTCLLVDRNGAVRKRYAGAISIDDVKTDVLALLREG